MQRAGVCARGRWGDEIKLKTAHGHTHTHTHVTHIDTYTTTNKHAYTEI